MHTTVPSSKSRIHEARNPVSILSIAFFLAATFMVIEFMVGLYTQSLALVAVDLSGRGYADIDCGLENQMVETLPGEMVTHFLESFAVEAKINLHVKILTGQNAHHKAESTFKALAKALRFALEIDPRSPTDIPSTKGTLGN